MYIVAHEDDTLFFTNPDITHDMQAGECVGTVVVTAGDDGLGQTYWQSRESGMESAYAQINGVTDTWSHSIVTANGQSLLQSTLQGNPRVTVTYLQLPDGGWPNGTGLSSDGNQSLRNVWSGSEQSIAALDGTATYTLQTLVGTLTALIDVRQPSTIGTQNYTQGYSDLDHPDHVTVGYLTRQAQLAYQRPHVLRAYQDYDIEKNAGNVTGSDLTGKDAAYYNYAPYDSQTCQTASACAGTETDSWLQRQYVVDLTASNLAPLATITASSQDTSNQQTAQKAADGIIGGYPAAAPADHTTEWATVGEGVGSWLQLSWASAHTVNDVKLFDRPNTSDQITSATLQFSDGSSVAVGALPNAGTVFDVPFSARSTSSVKLTVTGVSGSTQNIGLSEIQVLAAPPMNASTVLAGYGANSTASDSTGNDLTAGLFVASMSGTANHVNVRIAASGAGHIKAAVYSDARGAPGSLLAQTNEISGYSSGSYQLSLTAPLSVTIGAPYWIAIWSDSTTLRVNADIVNGNGIYITTPYGVWPNSPATTIANGCSYDMTLTP